eukprot:TRINITY_DN5827_c0_g1_i2.p1 TRINITY_DN5827_c0_g1~~TRINITY_DN5827_c0_g1_i2.p1  ORF type:complete len:509 (+),score=108.60 TRINITY_DN5827_c0_g1_i2:48-1574(+)
MYSVVFVSSTELDSSWEDWDASTLRKSTPNNVMEPPHDPKEASPKKNDDKNVDMLSELFEDEAPQPTEEEIKKEKLNFFAGNPTVAVAKGEIHLFKDAAEKSVPQHRQLPSKRTRLVIVLAVPSWMSLGDLYAFYGAFTAGIEQIRVLSDSSPNRYMTVIKFRQQKQADDFYLHYNGKPFSALGAEVCYVGFIKKVQFLQPQTAQIFPSEGQAELPTCPVCLERLDASESGVLTILCQHAFHCRCLIGWKEENRCPVCRYVQQPTGKETRCTKCGESSNLWICLVCGNVGCSRYKDLHAFEHYKETKHNYALELETQRVWDYAGDGYVHRLIHNKTDGKLVELPSPGQEHDDRSGGNDRGGVGKEEITKVDALSLEYQYLLTAQLETQRTWFEDQIGQIEQQKEFKIKTLEQQKKMLLEQKAQLANRAKQLETENLGLKLKTMEQDKLVSELQEQVKDLMFFIEAQKTIASETGELKDGQVVVVPAPASPSSSSTTPGKKKKGRGGKK